MFFEQTISNKGDAVAIMTRNKIFIACILALFGLAQIGIIGCTKQEKNKITIQSSSGKVDIEKKGDNSIKVTDEKTGAVISAQEGISPADLSIKVYPNAQISKSDTSMKVEVPQGTLINVFFVVNDKPGKVVDFYSKEVKNVFTSKSADRVSIFGKTDAGNSITVVINEQGGHTKIYLQEMIPKK